MIKPKAPRVFISASVAAAALHALSVLTAGFLTPGYPQSQRAISDLGISGQPYAFLINYMGFIFPGGFLLSAVSAGYKMRFPTVTKVRLLFIAGAGIFLIIAGFYPFPSLTHLTAALLAGLSASAGILSLSLYAGRQIGSSSLLASGITISLLILTDAATWVLAETLHIRLHNFMGLQQRIASFSAFFWFSAFAIASRRITRK